MRSASVARSWTRRVRRSLTLAVALAATLTAGLGLATPAAAQEQGWVRGEIRLNLRTGPGTQFRIVGGIATGDEVTVLQRGESWTQVRLTDGSEGWVPEGYLDATPPPTVRLGQLEAEVTRLRDQLGKTTDEARTLRETSASFSAIDSEQKAEIKRLTLDNMELRAGARWPEWITGAGIVGVGMMLGALLHRNATRPRSSRIRL